MKDRTMGYAYRRWRTVCVGLAAVAAQIVVWSPAEAQSTPTAASSRPPVMDREKEIALALGACPASVAGKAAVYVLDTGGYRKVRARNRSAWMRKARAHSFHAF